MQRTSAALFPRGTHTLRSTERLDFVLHVKSVEFLQAADSVLALFPKILSKMHE
jgi:hypothetical protein